TSWKAPSEARSRGSDTGLFLSLLPAGTTGERRRGRKRRPVEREVSDPRGSLRFPRERERRGKASRRSRSASDSSSPPPERHGRGLSAAFLATGVAEDLVPELRYRLEEARTDLREAHPDEAEAAARHVLAEADRYGLDRLAARAGVVLGEALALEGRVREAID